jgi:hypothetical protein
MLYAIMDLKVSVIPGFTVPYCLLYGTEGVHLTSSRVKTADMPAAEREYHRLEFSNPEAYGQMHEDISRLGGETSGDSRRRVPFLGHVSSARK